MSPSYQHFEINSVPKIVDDDVRKWNAETKPEAEIVSVIPEQSAKSLACRARGTGSCGHRGRNFSNSTPMSTTDGSLAGAQNITWH
eukprot:4332445-Pleurochrysis_carterae.AAC.5